MSSKKNQLSGNMARKQPKQKPRRSKRSGLKKAKQIKQNNEVLKKLKV